MSWMDLQKGQQYSVVLGRGGRGRMKDCSPLGLLGNGAVANGII